MLIAFKNFTFEGNYAKGFADYNLTTSSGETQEHISNTQ